MVIAYIVSGWATTYSIQSRCLPLLSTISPSPNAGFFFQLAFPDLFLHHYGSYYCSCVLLLSSISCSPFITVLFYRFTSFYFSCCSHSQTNILPSLCLSSPLTSLFILTFFLNIHCKIYLHHTTTYTCQFIPLSHIPISTSNHCRLLSPLICMLLHPWHQLYTLPPVLSPLPPHTQASYLRLILTGQPPFLCPPSTFHDHRFTIVVLPATIISTPAAATTTSMHHQNLHHLPPLSSLTSVYTPATSPPLPSLPSPLHLPTLALTLIMVNR